MQYPGSARRVIHFKDRDSEMNGFYILLRAKMPIRSAGEDRYLISEEQCKLLSDNKIEYVLDKKL